MSGRWRRSRKRLGATSSPNVLPSFWRFLNHFWLGAETVNVERSIVYFNSDGVGTDLLRLLARTAVIVVLLLLPISREIGRQRKQSIVAGVRMRA
jgi:hypothetical protein